MIYPTVHANSEIAQRHDSCEIGGQIPIWTADTGDRGPAISRIDDCGFAHRGIEGRLKTVRGGDWSGAVMTVTATPLVMYRYHTSYNDERTQELPYGLRVYNK